MNCQPSGSEAAYARLHREVQRWIREQGWSALRPVQVAAIGAVLDGKGDVLISASTAAGKTEAAFLPILSSVAGREHPGISILYVSPLKALINDQFGRLEQLCDDLDLPLVRWHGDAGQSAKTRMKRDPRGIALITPESLEAMTRRPGEVQRLLGELDYVVVDEVHALMQGPRGLHLASLLKRIDAVSEKPARRIGLSATIGNLRLAAAWLRPSAPDTVEIIDAPGDLDLQLQIRGCVATDDGKRTDKAPEGQEPDNRIQPEPGIAAMCEHMFGVLRGSNNLVFGGSRRTVEAVADALRTRSDAEEVPNEFFPHHGSLAKELREELEGRLKAGELPTTAVCTTTLELGIDIGTAKSIAHVGAPRSVSSLRQRLGRTGRREGTPSILRIYVTGPAADGYLMSDLRPSIVRAVAAIRLLSKRFVEPPTQSDALATALLHQTMSLILERGGARADEIFGMLAGSGPFESVTKADFVELLRHVTHRDVGIVEQASDGMLLLGPTGEKLAMSREFYAMFQGDQEWRLVLGGKTLGTIPLSNAVAIGNLVVLAGRRWQITDIDEKNHVLDVTPHVGGQLPKFEGASAEAMHDTLLAEMRLVYEDADVPAYLDGKAKTMLEDARRAYRGAGLGNTGVVEAGSGVQLFPWIGTAGASVLSMALASLGMNTHPNGLGVTMANVDIDEAMAALKKLSKFTAKKLEGIGEEAHGLCTAKYDEYVPEALLKRFWTRRNQAEIAAIPRIAKMLIG